MPGRYRKRRYNNSKKLNTAFKLARNNRRMMLGETKIMDTVITSDAIDVLGTVTNLVDIDQGLLGVALASANTARIGNQVYARSLTIRCRIKWADTGLENTVRILLVQKLASDFDNPTILSAVNTDVLENLAGADTLAHPKWINRKAYKILMDETLIGDPQRQENVVFKRYFKFRHKVNYPSATGTQPKQGGLFFMTFGSSNTGPPILDAQIRFTFKDM